MVGIILLNYNNYIDTIECVNSIRKTTIDYKIYIVDNASPNNSYEYLERYFCKSKDIVLLQTGYNFGYAAGNNMAINYLLKDNIEFGIISNTDVIFQENTVEEFRRGFAKYRKAGIIAPEILNAEKIVQYEHKHLILDFRSLIFTMSFLNRLNSKRCYKKMIGENQDFEKEIFCASGCCFAFRLCILNEKGMLFDNNTFLGYEEAILGQRLKDIGYSEVYFPCAKVIHNHKGPTSKLGYKGIVVCDSSEIYYAKQYLRCNRVQCMFLVFIRIVEYLLKGIKNKQLLRDFPKFYAEYKERFRAFDGLSSEDRRRIKCLEERYE